MNPLRTIGVKLGASLLLAACLVSPAFGEINLPTAVQFDKKIHFQSQGGEPVALEAGIYEVDATGENQLALAKVGTEESAAVMIKAQPANHEESLDTAVARLAPSPDNNEDTPHLIFWSPEGIALESVGSYSGVFSRSVLTWGQEGKEADAEEALTVEFEKDIYFKTVGGEPKALKAGEYNVALAGEDNLQLTSAGGESITVATDSLDSNAAFMLPDFGDNPDMQLLVLSTAGGQSILALGSHSGAFPRGWGFVKKLAKKAKKGIKKGIKKGYRVSKGKVKRVAKGIATAGLSEGKRLYGKHKGKIKGFVKKQVYKRAGKWIKKGAKFCMGKGKTICAAAATAS